MIFKIAQPRNLKWENIKIGDYLEFETKITEKELREFINLTHDINPLHQDPLFAQSKGFRKNIVHGMLLASFFSTLVGTYLPGKNCLYLSQTCQFKKPVFVGEKIKIFGRIKEKIKSTKILYLETNIFNEKKQKVVSGEAIIKYL